VAEYQPVIWKELWMNLQQLFELFTAVLLEVRTGQIKLEKQLEKLTKEIRELREQQAPDP
jgi:hypothetical protein